MDTIKRDRNIGILILITTIVLSLTIALFIIGFWIVGIVCAIMTLLSLGLLIVTWKTPNYSTVLLEDHLPLTDQSATLV